MYLIHRTCVKDVDDIILLSSSGVNNYIFFTLHLLISPVDPVNYGVLVANVMNKYLYIINVV